MGQEEDNEKDTRDYKFEWKDILAITLAIYQLLLFRVLLIVLAVIIVAVLMFTYWLN